MLTAIKQPLFYAAGLILMKGISFVMLPIVARYLTAEEYGSLDLWLSLLNVASIVIGFGLIDALYKRLGDVDDHLVNALIGTAAVAQIKIATIVALSAVPLIALSASVKSVEFSIQMTLLVVTLIAGALINVPLSWLRLIDHAKQFFFLTTSKALLQAGLTWYFLQLGLEVTGVLLSACISSVLLACVLMFLQHRRIQPSWLPVEGKKLYQYGWQLVLSGLLLFVAAGAERWILSSQVGFSALAQYAIAMQFSMMVAFLCEPLTLWWFPKRFNILKAPHGRKKAARVAELICHSSLFFAASLSVLSPWLIEWLLPQRYHSAIPLIPWLALGMAFKQMSHVLNVGCYLNSKPTVVLKINAAIAVIALFLFFTSSLLFGLQGVVAAFVSIYAIRAGVFVFVSQKNIQLPHQYLLLLSHIALITLINLTLNLTVVSFGLWLFEMTLLSLWVIKNFVKTKLMFGHTIGVAS